MLVIKNTAKTKAYIDELTNLIERAAADGVSLSVTRVGVPVMPEIPELDLDDENLKCGQWGHTASVQTPTLAHISCSSVFITSREYCVIDISDEKERSLKVDYTYAHTPGKKHPVPEPIDYSRYYKQDPNHPVNWLNPGVTVQAALSTDMSLETACCTQIDKFCNSDVWRGNLHAVVTTAIADLISQNKLKYIGAK